MFYNTQEMILMKKLEERASFQQAIELHGRKLMNLQLMDLKNINHHRHDQFRRSLSSVSSIPSPSALSYSPNNQVHLVSSDKTEQEVSKGRLMNQVFFFYVKLDSWSISIEFKSDFVLFVLLFQRVTRSQVQLFCKMLV